MKVENYSYWQIFYEPDIPLMERVGLAAISPVVIPLIAFAACSSRTYTGNVYIENTGSEGDGGNITPPDATSPDSKTGYDTIQIDTDTEIKIDTAPNQDTYTSADILPQGDIDTPDAGTDVSFDAGPPPNQCASQVTLPSSCNFVSISAGQTSTFVAMKDGSVKGWGKISHIDGGYSSDLFSATTPNTVAGFKNITQLSIRFQHLLARDTSGNVWAMGQNAWGQLGNGKSPFSTKMNEDSATPVEVINLFNAVMVAAGNYHSMALDNKGTLFAWGQDAKGQIGLPLQMAIEQPTAVSFPKNDTIVNMGCGDLQSFAVQQSGLGYMWGDYTGTAVYSPTVIDKGFLKIAGGSDFMCALGNSCAISCMGSINASNTLKPISTLSKLSDIAAGGQTAIAITESGDAYTWDAANPTPTLIGLGKIAMATVASDHSCVVTAGCEVYCTGANQAGQLGDDTTTDSSSWVKVTGLP